MATPMNGPVGFVRNLRPLRMFSLAQKLALLIMGTVVIVLAVALVLTYNALARSSETETGERLASVAREVGSLLAAGRRRTTTNILALAKHPAVVSALTADGTRLTADVARARDAMDRWAPAGTDTLTPVELWTSSGRRLAAVGRPVPLEDTVVDTRQPQSAGAGMLPVARPGLRSLPKPDATEIGELYLDGGQAAYWTLAPVVADDMVVGYIAQQTRFAIPQVTMNTLRGLVGTDFSVHGHSADGKLWVNSSGAEAAPMLEGKLLKDTTAVDSITAESQLFKSTPFARFFTTGQGSRAIGVEILSPDRPWRMVLDTPLQSAHLHARQLLVRIAGLGLLLAAIGAVVSVVVGRRVAKPLETLTVAAEAVAQGDYSQRVVLRGDDEIGRLSSTFNQMAAEVEQARAEMQQRFEETQAAARQLERSNEELRVAKEEAERSREEAQLANRAKSDFLAVMSHELRTPLNAIGGYTQLIDLGIHGPITDAQHDALHRIARSQAHLLRLINDVLNFARVDAGQVRYAMRDVPLSETIAALEPLVSLQMSAKRLTYMYEQCDAALTVYADSDKLQQIVLNLLTNAIKFTPEGGRVSVRCEHDGEHVRIRVEDTGVGIPQERVAAIFDPFVQLDRTTTQAMDGVGLGLAISRDLARGMSGDLDATSELGVGSTFTVVLPVHAAAASRNPVSLNADASTVSSRNAADRELV